MDGSHCPVISYRTRLIQQWGGEKGGVLQLKEGRWIGEDHVAQRFGSNGKD